MLMVLNLLYLGMVLKQDLKYDYDVYTILQSYEDFIDTLDRPADENKKKLLPRYKKMKRLESSETHINELLH